MAIDLISVGWVEHRETQHLQGVKYPSPQGTKNSAGIDLSYRIFDIMIGCIAKRIKSNGSPISRI
ncbi:MAG: hypothetical protein RLZZ338_4384 [Cyanobacteriota bacterium]